MEPDISILRKTGHFYFALTRICHHSHHSRLRQDELRFSRFISARLTNLAYYYVNKHESRIWPQDNSAEP
jgi:hypothetical protein